jgi:hypothetical protein
LLDLLFVENVNQSVNVGPTEVGNGQTELEAAFAMRFLVLRFKPLEENGEGFSCLRAANEFGYDYE